ncbi:uncharacterized protein BDV17DRAFT_270598 [Aspergillus undulatus]|uniref:uncharacterized protein n=1 Tax=Aspergillus undulatus TaxID=1810928 RepID=UPI003CCDFAD8
MQLDQTDYYERYFEPGYPIGHESMEVDQTGYNRHYHEPDYWGGNESIEVNQPGHTGRYAGEAAYLPAVYRAPQALGPFREPTYMQGSYPTENTERYVDSPDDPRFTPAISARSPEARLDPGKEGANISRPRIARDLSESRSARPSPGFEHVGSGSNLYDTSQSHQEPYPAVAGDVDSECLLPRKPEDGELFYRYDNLDPRYCVQPHSYFQCGKVFATLWHEYRAAMSDAATYPLQYVRGSFGEPICSTIRRMVVIENSGNCSLCLSWLSYCKNSIHCPLTLL